MSHVSFPLKSKLITMLCLAAAFTTGCTSQSDDDGVGVNPPIVKKVTRDNYLSGRKFCDMYASITKNEYGKYIKVPVSYDRPDGETIEIYAYTTKPFDPQKPSYLFVDGGPGQNTHGSMKDYTDGNVNEIRFDQRGLGCSAPETYEQYSNSNLYSTDNNVRDMEKIREAFGPEKWSVYGISYGTVPATLYGAQFPESTTLVVLEGVVGDLDQLHLEEYKTEKLNMVLESLSSTQRLSFSKLIAENSKDTSVVVRALFELFYSDAGMRTAKTVLTKIFEIDGNIRRDLIAKLRASIDERENKFPLPQQPGAVDENVLTIIYCKNLGKRNQIERAINYKHDRGFYTEPDPDPKSSSSCDQAGVTIADEVPYLIDQVKVSAPIYYFQGSHDGATLAKGAISHWKKVPTGKSYFMLAQKGGHNPNLTRLHSENASIQSHQKSLFQLSVLGKTLTQKEITKANSSAEDGQSWILYPDQQSGIGIEAELEGIQRLQRVL